MKDIIYRQDAIDALGDIHPLDYNAQAYKARIEKLPSAEQERNRGKWIFVNKFRGQHKCSVCGVVAAQVRDGFHLESSQNDNTGEHAIVINHYKELLSYYCYNCGSQMEV